MERKRGLWIGLLILLIAATGGGYAYYRYVYRPGAATSAPTLVTAQVKRGDLVISVSGSGLLSPAEERSIGFQTPGYLAETLVEVGDYVHKGDVLARLETGDLTRAVVKAEMAVRKARLDLEEVSAGPTEAELANARAALQSARNSLATAVYASRTAQNSTLDADVRARLVEFQWAVSQYYLLENGYQVSQERLDKAWEKWASSEAELNLAVQRAKMEELEVSNQVDQARNRVYQAQAALELLESGPATDTVKRAELALSQATLSLEQARANLAAAELRAPFDGVVAAVNGIPGAYVGSNPIVTLVDLSEPLLCFWVEEADMSGVAVGNRVEIVFEALPDDVFTGRVVRIDPALTKVGNTLAVQAWASIDLASHPASLFSGMNADVEVISAEARDAVLAPLQALRELAQGKYAVFVVQPDGELSLRLVEVGLQDLVNAEIRSGLEPGEVVSLGEQTSAGTQSGAQATPGPMGFPMLDGGGPMGPGGGPMGPP